MGNPRTTRRAPNRWSPVGASIRQPWSTPRGPSVPASGADESPRPGLAWFAAGTAAAILLGLGWLAYVIGSALAHGASWRLLGFGPPLLATASAVVVKLWRIAERLSLPHGSLHRRADAILALTGQQQRQPRGGTKAKHERRHRAKPSD